MRISKMLLTTTLICLVIALPSRSALAETPLIVDGFDDGIDPGYWRIYTNQPLFTIDDTNGDVLMSKPTGGNGWGHWDYVFLCLEREVTGNFTASVDFSNLVIELSDVGCNAISIEHFFGGQVHSLVRQECEDGGDMIGPWLDPPQEFLGQPNASSSGTLKVVRSGTTVISFLDDVEVHRDDFNANMVTDLCFGLGNNHSVDAVSVRFDNFFLTADGIDDPPGQWRKIIAAATTNNGDGYTALDFYPARSEAAIAYTDPDTEELKVARGTRNSTGWLWAEPEIAASEGQAVDLGYDACGDLWLSYLTGNKKLTVKMAHWDSDDRTWADHQIDRGAKRWVTSLSNPAGSCGQPSVIYGVDAGGDGQIRFAEGELPPVVVDSGLAGEGAPMPPGSGVGSFSSLTHDADGAPAAAYSYMDESGCRWIKFASRSTGTWLPEDVFSYGGRIVREISLTYRDGNPAVAFTDAAPQPMNYCERSGGWVCEELHYGPFGTPSAVVDGEGTLTIGAHHWGPNYQPELWMFRKSLATSGWHVKRLPWFSASDAALDLDDNPAFCFWEGSRLHLAYLDTGVCATNDDCDDMNPCTTDTCGLGGVCEHSAATDGIWCGGASDVCCLGQCTTPWCSADTDCNDGDECTIDTCFIGTNPPCSSYCEHESIPDCGCVPTHSKEKGPRCTDGLDNDCDGPIDGDDPDCQ